jgi:hypothetical protein
MTFAGTTSDTTLGMSCRAPAALIAKFNTKAMALLAGVVLSATLGAVGAANAGSATVTVLGTSNPFLAGQPTGTTCCSGDSAPNESPVLVPGALVAGSTLTFSGTGGFLNQPGTPSDSLDGDHSGQSLTSPFTMTADYGTGIAGAENVNVNGLVGVFLTDALPTDPAPTPITYGAGGNSGGLALTSYSPGLGQIFWIGDGLTGTGIGAIQQFIVPTGATRLYLGTVDGFGWFNNIGTGVVTVDGLSSSGTPEPAAWALMIGGFGLAGASLRRRRRVAAA